MWERIKPLEPLEFINFAYAEHCVVKIKVIESKLFIKSNCFSNLNAFIYLFRLLYILKDE